MANVDTSALGDERSTFLQERLNPILHEMVTEIICEQPDDVCSFMAEWLRRRQQNDADLAAVAEQQGADGFPIDAKKLRTVVQHDKVNALNAENLKLKEELHQVNSQLAEKNGYRADEKKRIAELKSSQRAAGGDAGAADSDKESSEEEDSDDEMSEADMPPPPKKRGPRSSVSAEAYGAWNKKETNYTAPVYEKNDMQRMRIVDVMAKSFLFQTCDEGSQSIIIGAMQEVVVQPGEKVIQQGDDGECMYIIEKGKLLLS